MPSSLPYLAVAAVCFVLGVCAQRFGWHDGLRPYVLFVLGRTGGCSLSESRAYRQTRLCDAEKDLNTRCRLLKSVDGLELWDTPRGLYWVPANFESFIEILAEQAVDIYGSAECRVRKGDIVLDCGANVGVFTRTAVDAGAGRVIALEPVPQKIECLNRNFESEIAAGQVSICPKGVWSENATLTMGLYKNPVLDSFIIQDRSIKTFGTAELPVTTIDHLVAELGLPRVDFIKMDVEGANPQALEGARETLSRHKPRLAVSTEDVDEDFLSLPPLVRQIVPDYRCVPGRARLRSRFQIAPDVLYFS